MTVFGDAEAAVCEILRAALDATVSTDLVGYDRAAPWVRVTRSGGEPILWMQLDAPTVVLDVYAPDKAAAHDLATAARAAVFAQCGAYTGWGLALYDVGDAGGLAWNTDEPGLAHYTLSLALVTRPT